MIKQRLKLAGGTNKALFHDLFASASSDGEEDDEEFYKNASDSESKNSDAPGMGTQQFELGGKIPGSVPGMPTKTGQLPTPQSEPLQAS